MTYDAVIFDVDGTLLDTSEGLISAVNYTIDVCGLTPLTESQLRTFIGPPIQNSLAKYYDLSPEKIQEIAEIFRDAYKEKFLLQAIPYEGIYTVLDKLVQNHIKVGIATYKREDYALQILEHFHFDKYATVMHGADNFNQMKKKDIIQLCVKEMGLTDPSRIIMVGDSDNDAIGAADAGMKFIGVTYGFGFASKEDVMQFENVGVSKNTKDFFNILRQLDIIF